MILIIFLIIIDIVFLHTVTLDGKWIYIGDFSRYIDRNLKYISDFQIYQRNSN